MLKPIASSCKENPRCLTTIVTIIWIILFIGETLTVVDLGVTRPVQVFVIRMKGFVGLLSFAKFAIS